MLSKNASQTLGSQVPKYIKKRFFTEHTSLMMMERGHTGCSLLETEPGRPKFPSQLLLCAFGSVASGQAHTRSEPPTLQF